MLVSSTSKGVQMNSKQQAKHELAMAFSCSVSAAAAASALHGMLLQA
jgi:hypothetical protein